MGEQEPKSLLSRRIEEFETPWVHSLPLSLMSWHRQRKDELEQRMSALQESRRELMVQLEGLMKLLKVRNLLVERQHLPPFPACSGVSALLSHPKIPSLRGRRGSFPAQLGVGCRGLWFHTFVEVKHPEPEVWGGLTELRLVPGAQHFPLCQENKPGAGQGESDRDRELALHSPCHTWGLALGLLGLALGSSTVWGPQEGFLGWAPTGDWNCVPPLSFPCCEQTRGSCRAKGKALGRVWSQGRGPRGAGGVGTELAQR